MLELKDNASSLSWIPAQNKQMLSSSRFKIIYVKVININDWRLNIHVDLFLFSIQKED